MTLRCILINTIKTKACLNKMIKKIKGGYKLVSKTTGRNLGTAKAKAGIEKREKQVNYFKYIASKKKK